MRNKLWIVASAPVVAFLLCKWLIDPVFSAYITVAPPPFPTPNLELRFTQAEADGVIITRDPVSIRIEARGASEGEALTNFAEKIEPLRKAAMDDAVDNPALTTWAIHVVEEKPMTGDVAIATLRTIVAVILSIVVSFYFILGDRWKPNKSKRC